MRLVAPLSRSKKNSAAPRAPKIETKPMAMKAFMKTAQGVAKTKRAAKQKCRGSYSAKLLGVIAVLCGVTLTASLGVWQLQRAQTKIQAQAQWDQALARAPQLFTATTVPVLADQLQHAPLRVQLRGRWLSASSVWLDNRAFDRRAGFWKVTPLQLNDAAGRQATVLVLRGWAPRDPADRTRLPATLEPNGEVNVEGVALPALSHLMQLGRAPQSGPLPAVWQNLDYPAFEAASGLKVEPLVVQQTDAATQEEGLTRVPLRVAVGPEQHYGYAAQWFAMSALLAGGAFFLARRARRASLSRTA